MDTESTPPPPPGTHPLAIASPSLAVVGVITYCCGSFVCLGWIAPVFWLAGLICGGIALSQGHQGTSKTLAIVGVAMNVLFGLGFIGLMIVGVGFGVLSTMMDAANQY